MIIDTDHSGWIDLDVAGLLNGPHTLVTKCGLKTNVACKLTQKLSNCNFDYTCPPQTEEFVSGCMQLHGPAKSLQLAQMSPLPANGKGCQVGQFA